MTADDLIPAAAVHHAAQLDRLTGVRDCQRLRAERDALAAECERLRAENEGLKRAAGGRREDVA